MSSVSSLNENNRERLRHLVSLLVGMVDVARARGIIREEGGSKTKGLKVNLKVQFPDTSAICSHLEGMLEHVGARHTAYRILATLAQEAWRSPSLDNRARNVFEQAQTAIDDGDWVKLPRLHEKLEVIRASCPHPLLDEYRAVIAFGSNKPDRIMAALSEHADELTAAPDKQPLRVGTTENVAQPRKPAARMQPVQKAERLKSDTEPRQSVATTQAARILTVATAEGAGTATAISESQNLRRALAEVMSSVEVECQPDTSFLTEEKSIRNDWRNMVREFLETETPDEAELPPLDGPIGRVQQLCDDALMKLGSLREKAERARQQAERAERFHSMDRGIAILRSEYRRVDEALANLSPNADLSVIREALSIAREEGLATALDAIQSRLDAINEEAKRKQLIAEKLRELKELGVSVDLGAGPGGPAPSPVESTAPSNDSAVAVKTDVGLRFANVKSCPQSFLWSTYCRQFAPVEGSDYPRVMLPIDHTVDFPLAPPHASANERTTAAAAFLLQQAARFRQHPISPLSLAVTMLEDADRLAELARGTDESAALREAVLAMLLASAGPSRYQNVGRELVSRICRAEGISDVHSALLDSARLAVTSGGCTLVLVNALNNRFDGILAQIACEVAAVSPSAGRQWVQALAAATASMADGRSQAMRQAMYRQAGADDALRLQLEALLDESRLKRRVSGFTLDAPSWLTDYVRDLGLRTYELGSRGSANVNVSIPELAQQRGIYCREGDRSVSIPLLVRNAGQRGVAGVELGFSDPTKEEVFSVPDQHRFRHLAWLSRDRLRDAQDELVEVPVEMQAETAERLRLRVSTWWPEGSGSTYDLEVSLVRGAEPVKFSRVPGSDGQPVDLNNEEVLNRSSASARECYEQLTELLRAGEPVMALVYGRRRRGKSSISRSLANNPEIRRTFVVQRNVWNFSRMTSISRAFEHLASLIRAAILERSGEVQPFVTDDIQHRDQIFSAYRRWLEEAARTVQPVHVLLLLDEFQRWLSGLSQSDRQAVLNCFRDFNEGAIGKLRVSFVLTGLRVLKSYSDESADFAAAVRRYEISGLNMEESDRYLRECFPLDNDCRVRRRLGKLAGGNPFVLNILCDELVQYVGRGQSRSHCLVTDVDNLVESGDTGGQRIHAYLRYMLREDEEDESPTLPQLTMLRAVASVIKAGGDFDRGARVAEIVEWLRSKNLTFEEPLAMQQLKELVDLGVLERERSSGLYILAGEWMCRWLASLDEAQVPLLPVVTQMDPDLVARRYRLKKHLADGGQAHVWLAEDVEVGGRELVLKIYERSFVDMRLRVERERDLLQRINSRYVVRCLGAAVDESKGSVVILEWVPGCTLRQLLDQPPKAASAIIGPNRDLSKQLDLLKKITDGVAAVHLAHVVHKDLSPGNIMLLEEGGVWEPKIIDFGISGMSDCEDPEPNTVAKFTPGYTAPEKMRGASRTMEADIYSLGILFLELLVGTRPSGQDTEALLRSAASALPVKLVRIIDKMLAEDPRERPTADVVRIELDGALEAETWDELKNEAEERYLNSEFAAAMRLFEKAVVGFPVDKRGATEHCQLLSDAIACAQDCDTERVAVLISETISVAARYGTFHTWDKFVGLIKQRAGIGNEATEPKLVLDNIEKHEPTRNLVNLLEALIEGALYLRTDCERFYQILIGYVDLLDKYQIAKFCVVCARAARISFRMVAAELWLRRARALNADDMPEYVDETKELGNQRSKTGTQITLPKDCKEQDEKVIGRKEKGHLDVDQLEQFAARLRRVYPFICSVRRVDKNCPPVNRPTLLPLANIPQHRCDGIADVRIIPFALDPSFTRSSASLRMNIVLPDGTSHSQREAAYRVLQENDDLFPR